MNYEVKCVSFTKDVKDFLKNNHYTKSFPVAPQFCFVLLDGTRLVGVALFSNFARQQAAAYYLDYLELSRLCLLDEAPRNSESYFIAQTLRYLKRYTKILGVISYADPTAGHSGTVYKASNFIFVGKTKPSYHYEKDDQFIYKKRVWVASKKENKTEAVYAQERGLTKIPECPKLIFSFTFPRRTKERGVIYKITSPSNKVYVGQTTQPLDARFRGHLSDARMGAQRPICGAFRKYGTKMIMEVIEGDVPVSNLTNRELYWQSFYDACNPQKGYNTGIEENFVSRVPEDLLLSLFDLRKEGLTYDQIAQRTGLTAGWISSVIWGRSRPDIRNRWLETNDDLEKQKAVADEDVLQLFFLHDEGKSLPEIAAETDVSEAYISAVLRGRLRKTIKLKYEKQTGRSFVYENTKTVDRALALSVLRLRYDSTMPFDDIASSLNLTYRQVWSITVGETAEEVYDQFFENRERPEAHKYSDDILTQAFDLRFIESIPSAEIATRLGLDPSFLSLVYNGRTRPDIKQRWESQHGSTPSIKAIRSAAGKSKSHTKNQFGTQKCVVSSDGRRWSSITACAKEIGVSPIGLKKALDKGNPCKGVDVRYES